MLFILLDGGLFVRTSNKTNWGKNLKENPTIQVKLGNLKFSADTERVESVKNSKYPYNYSNNTN